MAEIREAELKHWFVWDDELEYLRMEVETPYEKLSDYFDSNVMNARNAQATIDYLQPVLDGRTPHISGTGNGWWLEVRPQTTRVGDLYASPSIELELPTETFFALHIAYRDGRLAHAARRSKTS